MSALSIDIEATYELIKTEWEKHLKEYGISLPALRFKDGRYTKDALVLVCLAQGYPNTDWVTKEALTEFIRQYYPGTTDVQSGRHLGVQKGFYILSSKRGNNYPPDKPPPPGKAPYLLQTLQEPHPSFRPGRKGEITEEEFERIKEEYHHRCATCGSKEGESNYHYPSSITVLQKAHRNPHLPLIKDNIIPQCQFCNRADRNNWIYDERGRVVGVAVAQPILNSIKKGWMPLHEVEKLWKALSSYFRSHGGESSS